MAEDQNGLAADEQISLVTRFLPVALPAGIVAIGSGAYLIPIALPAAIALLVLGVLLTWLGKKATHHTGEPLIDEVSTSYVERQNLTMRMNVRWLTNGHSKKLENHGHAISLHYMYYNFCRKHETLTKQAGGVHTTPAIAAGLSDRVWKVSEMKPLKVDGFLSN